MIMNWPRWSTSVLTEQKVIMQPQKCVKILRRQFPKTVSILLTFPQLLNKLAKVQPTIFLDVFLEGDDVEDYQRRRMFSDDLELHDNPLSQISDIDILSWCEKDTSSR